MKLREDSVHYPLHARHQEEEAILLTIEVENTYSVKLNRTPIVNSDAMTPPTCSVNEYCIKSSPSTRTNKDSYVEPSHC